MAGRPDLDSQTIYGIIVAYYQPGDEMASTGEAGLGLQAEVLGPR